MERLRTDLNVRQIIDEKYVEAAQRYSADSPCIVRQETGPFRQGYELVCLDSPPYNRPGYRFVLLRKDINNAGWELHSGNGEIFDLFGLVLVIKKYAGDKRKLEEIEFGSLGIIDGVLIDEEGKTLSTAPEPAFPSANLLAGRIAAGRLVDRPPSWVTDPQNWNI